MLWQYARGEGRPVQVQPKDAGVVRYFYAIPDGEGGRDHSVEEGLAKLENAVAPVLDKLIDDNAHPSHDEWKHLVLFVGTMAARTVKMREAFKATGPQAFTEALKDFMRSDPRYEESLREFNVQRGHSLDSEELRTAIESGDLIIEPTWEAEVLVPLRMALNACQSVMRTN